jgi:hypothetical protein
MRTDHLERKTLHNTAVETEELPLRVVPNWEEQAEKADKLCGCC